MDRIVARHGELKSIVLSMLDEGYVPITVAKYVLDTILDWQVKKKEEDEGQIAIDFKED